jgi:hypothetical protein
MKGPVGGPFGWCWQTLLSAPFTFPSPSPPPWYTSLFSPLYISVAFGSGFLQLHACSRYDMGESRRAPKKCSLHSPWRRS